MNTKTPADAPARSPVTEWLDAEMDRVWLLGELCLRRMQQGGLRPGREHPALAEIEAITASRRAARVGQQGTTPDVAELEQALMERVRALGARRRATPLHRLVHALGLRPLEVEALILATAPHIDQPLSHLFALLRGETRRRGVDLALVSLLHRLDRQQRVALLDVVDGERPLLGWRLLQIASPDSPDAYASMSSRPLQPTLDLLSVLCGRGELSSSLRLAAQLHAAPSTVDDLVLDPEALTCLHGLCQEAAASREGEAALPWLLLWGPAGAGKRTTAARWAAGAGRPLLAYDPRQVAKAQAEEVLRRAQREALLHGAVLYVGPMPEDAAAGADLLQRLGGHPGPVALGVEAMQPPRLQLDRPLREVAVPLPGEAARLRLWERHLPAAVCDPALDLRVLARSYQLTPGEIAETAAEAAAIERLRRGLVGEEELRQGIDRRLRNGLGEIARRVIVNATWDDLVLPGEDLDRVGEFISRGLYAQRVYGDWGFGRRLGGGKGMVGLFSGPPGTGKTMLAGLIAEALGLSLYQVDLSQVVSKWVGETEKQLSRVFDQAERAHAVLLFDEADALFGRRTEVKTANDRYGNLAVNYLLQRLEQYRGVAILTTNKEAALDEALQRRLSLHLRLQVPEAEERERLWRSMLPREAPCAGDLDFAELARRYELSGGYIKNAVVRAAFLAAGTGARVHMRLLHHAAALELEDMGRLVSRTQVRRPDIAQGLGAAAHTHKAALRRAS